jgi:hypothetical protein
MEEQEWYKRINVFAADPIEQRLGAGFNISCLNMKHLHKTLIAGAFNLHLEFLKQT